MTISDCTVNNMSVPSSAATDAHWTFSFPRPTIKSSGGNPFYLGEFNDVCVALAVYRPLVAQQPQAWFALGWLAARREATLAACSRSLKRLRKARPFWPD